MAPGRKQLLLQLWLWFAEVSPSRHFRLHYSHTVASEAQAKKELGGGCDVLNLLIVNNHISIKNLRRERQSLRDTKHPPKR